MTTDEWRSTPGGITMLDALPATVSARKRRLFACECARRAWAENARLLVTARIEAAEAVADGRLGEATLSRLTSQLGARGSYSALSAAEALVSVALRTDIDEITYLAGRWLIAYRVMHRYETGDDMAGSSVVAEAVRGGANREVADLLREIVGDPFRDIAIPTHVLAANDRAAVHIARAIYDDRDFARLPILADALEDGGCDDADILAHCRDGGGHVRGCWVVDLVLGKG